MDRDSAGEPSPWRAARSVLRPNPLVAIAVLALMLLIFAVFVFGNRGKYPDADVSDLLRTISVGVLAAGVSALIDRHITYRVLDRKISAGLREAEGISTSLTRLGVHQSHPIFDFGLPFREAKKGETVSWLDTYCPRQNEFIEDVLAAVTRGVIVRMMIIDPNSPNAHHRDQELSATFDTGDGWAAGLNAFTSKMRGAAARGHGRFEIRVYNDLPCVPMYLIGRQPMARRGYFSVFLVRPTAQCPHIELRAGQLLADMAAYFEAKWIRHAPPSRTASAVPAQSPEPGTQ